MARSVKFESEQSRNGRKVLIGAPLLVALLFCFAFTLFSPHPLQSHKQTAAASNANSLVTGKPQQKLSATTATPQTKLTTAEKDDDPSLAAVANSTKTASPQSNAANSHALQAAGKSSTGDKNSQSLLNKGTNLAH